MIVLFKANKKYSDKEMLELILVKDYPLLLVKYLQQYGLEVVMSSEHLATLVAKSSEDQLWFKDADYEMVFDFYKEHYQHSKNIVIIGNNIIAADFEQADANLLFGDVEKRLIVRVDTTKPKATYSKYMYDFIIDKTDTVFRFRKQPAYEGDDLRLKLKVEGQIDYELDDFELDHI